MIDFMNITANSAGFDWYAWVILPLIIFVARIFDVTLGTLRIIFVARGKRNLAPLLGFFEVLIWIVVISQLVQNLESATAYIGYAAGFAAGNYFGMWLEDKLALGTYILRLITTEEPVELVQRLRDAGFGVTTVEGEGKTGAVHLIYTFVKRRDVEQVLTVIHEVKPNAFVSMEEVRSTEKGIFPSGLAAQARGSLWRKSK
ncbi:MAG TPA: DUF2179 domain-containing protein [Anaerolineaceae bacterium]|nr:DUF2179 domain-containing protein [Anaerolineaceae bacterium]